MNIFRKVFFIIAIVLVGIGCEELTTEAAPAEPAPPPTKTDPAAENPTTTKPLPALEFHDESYRRSSRGEVHFGWKPVKELMGYEVFCNGVKREHSSPFWYRGDTVITDSCQGDSPSEIKYAVIGYKQEGKYRVYTEWAERTSPPSTN